MHCFHYKYDYLLYQSTVKFVRKKNMDDLSDAQRQEYWNLGNYNHELLNTGLLSNIHFHSVDDLIAGYDRFDQDEDPYCFNPLHTRIEYENDLLEDVDKVWNNTDYSSIKDLEAAQFLTRLANNHRYFFTCRPVVDELKGLLT